MTRLDATRTFYRLCRENKCDLKTINAANAEIHKANFAPQKKESLSFSFSFLKKKYYKLSNAIVNNIAYSHLVARLPRPVVYGIIRNMMYLFYLAEKYSIRIVHACRRIKGGNRTTAAIYKKYKRPHQLSKSENRSLREIVKDQRQQIVIPDTITDKNRQLLLSGR